MRAIFFPPQTLGAEDPPTAGKPELHLALALAVLRIRADHAHHATPMYNLALHANFLY